MKHPLNEAGMIGSYLSLSNSSWHPDDEAAAQVGPQQRRHGLPSFPDDAVADWEVLLAGGVAADSHDVVPMKSDGFTVFQVSSRLCSALVRASSGRLVEDAGAWAELAAVKDESVPAETRSRS
ncbi:hypothetical protein ACU4GG_43285 [Streptomyces nojiriensis]